MGAEGSGEAVALVPATCFSPVSHPVILYRVSAGGKVPLLKEREIKFVYLMCSVPDITGDEQRGCVSGLKSHS